MRYLILVLLFISTPAFSESEKVSIVLGSFQNEELAIDAATNLAREISLPLTIDTVHVTDVDKPEKLYYRIRTTPMHSMLGEQMLVYIKDRHPDAWLLKSV